MWRELAGKVLEGQEVTDKEALAVLDVCPTWAQALGLESRTVKVVVAVSQGQGCPG
ncbi:hypothetical protein [Pontibacillus salipaludis]|uniref:Uncharacterized protein n=1 Tax=Pontibacillus salipaludis TaxID=1697394 RepID=A0ABQ1QIZ4_9BACI|nr:hypothetical protein [Pontibacillus salipaludis]GGD28705.1 hypothetical protein GCM10011389_40320 [Pontibacillus salipaludis]